MDDYNEHLTEYGHDLIQTNAVDIKYNTPEHYPVRYNRAEYEQQIKRMEDLGIPVYGQMFEQCVNFLLMAVENKYGRFDDYNKQEH